MKISSPEFKKPRVEMLPLIDVVFLLLVVFIYTMLSMSIHNGMPLVLPVSSTVKPEKEMTLAITVKNNCDIFLNTEPVNLKQLSDLIETKASSDKSRGVLLFAEGDTSYQFLFNVLDRIREAGMTKISLQAKAGDRR